MLSLPEDAQNDRQQLLIEALQAHLAILILLNSRIKCLHGDAGGVGMMVVHGLLGRLSVTVEDYSRLLTARACLSEAFSPDIGTAVPANGNVSSSYPLEVAAEICRVLALSETLAAYGQGVREASRLIGALGDTDVERQFTEFAHDIDDHIHLLWIAERHLGYIVR